jgi:peptidoglycan/xylan/chitin deacetylase (PgdA/CDA1 family)
LLGSPLAYSFGASESNAYKAKAGEILDGDGSRFAHGDIVKGEEVRGKLCFTFDDGPDYRTTPILLDQLDRFGVKAAFFVNGWKIHNESAGGEESREILRQMALRGHLIGSHTFSHANLATLTEEGAKAEIGQVEGQLMSTLGRTLRLFRPPFGSMGPREHSIVTRLGYRVVMWNLDTLDWQARNASQIVRNFKRVISENPLGGIVVMHDTNRSSIEAFPLMMEWLRERNEREAATGNRRLQVVGLEQYLTVRGR